MDNWRVFAGTLCLGMKGKFGRDFRVWVKLPLNRDYRCSAAFNVGDIAMINGDADRQSGLDPRIGRQRYGAGGQLLVRLRGRSGSRGRLSVPEGLSHSAAERKARTTDGPVCGSGAASATLRSSGGISYGQTRQAMRLIS
ncbi:hypothetical protein GOODEAATRI_007187 [Goodea atripinnis]|uniref:Uncharacterized protein n=1 Tax=Goodea atripinnis TaxID=208336 RepID=A0ABV0N1G0_9TELE